MWRWCVLLFLVAALYAERRTGELRLSVVDSTGAGIEAAGSLLSQAIQLNQTFSTDNQGRHVARNLPFGLYRLNIDRPSFAPFLTNDDAVRLRGRIPSFEDAGWADSPAATAGIHVLEVFALDRAHPRLVWILSANPLDTRQARDLRCVGSVVHAPDVEYFYLSESRDAP